ncbi:MAG TPA: hypothetical protein VHX61_05715 [Rhizomicrobium sp.]|nr:hypothetical protein [Rhizomicrobium sp.]
METASPQFECADPAQALRGAATSGTDPRSLGRGLELFAVHVLLYFGTLLGAVANFGLPVNIMFGVANGAFIALLFIIGHDGCHGSFVPQRSRNVWLARLAFIPCIGRILGPYLAWYAPGFHPWRRDDRALIAKSETESAPQQA